jgi:hypothetical protein
VAALHLIIIVEEVLETVERQEAVAHFGAAEALTAVAKTLIAVAETLTAAVEVLIAVEDVVIGMETEDLEVGDRDALGEDHLTVEAAAIGKDFTIHPPFLFL